MSCSMCGLEFNGEQAGRACRSCPVSRGCHLVRCPRCGYEMPPEARLVAWLRQIARRWRNHRTGPGQGTTGRSA